MPDIAPLPRHSRPAPRVRPTALLVGAALLVVATACDREIRRVAGTYAMEMHDNNSPGMNISEYDTLTIARDGTFLRRHVTILNGEPHELDPVGGKVKMNKDLIHLIPDEGDQVVLRRDADGELNPEPNPRMMIAMMRDRELRGLWTEAKARGLIQPYVRVR